MMASPISSDFSLRFREATDAVRVDAEPLEDGPYGSHRRASAIGRPVQMQILSKRVRTERGEDTVLVVEEGVSATAARGEDRRASTARARLRQATAQIIHQDRFDRLQREQVGAVLERLDRYLTPSRGLRQLDAASASWRDCDAPRARGRILLLLHGTFSNSDNLLVQIKANPDGEAFLRSLFASNDRQGYDQILAFDHPTLGVSPVLNARELALSMAASEAEIDVICHSRGGLVARWWLEAFESNARHAKRRVVFLGAPLGGTSLAAPPSLRSSLSLLANIGTALELTNKALSLQFFALTGGLFQLLTSVTSLLAKTPAVDAAVALVPGLKAQSRVENSHELLSLRTSPSAMADRYAFVTSNFEPEDVGWAFWRMIPDARIRVFDRVADRIFQGDNDLVVDLQSMVSLSDETRLDQEQVLDFGTSSKVHHLNYLAQPETVDFVKRWFA